MTSFSVRRIFVLTSALVIAVSTLEFNEFPQVVQMGWHYAITYRPIDDTETTITLGNDSSINGVEPIATLTSMRDFIIPAIIAKGTLDSAKDGKYWWTVSTILTEGNAYILMISQPDVKPDYITQLSIVRTKSTLSSATVASSFTLPPTTITPSTSISNPATPTSPTAPSSGTQPASDASTSSSPASKPISSGGLSTGAKAGIGVGATTGSLILALAAYYLRVFARKKPAATPDDEQASAAHNRLSELDGKGVLQEDTVAELEGTPTTPGPMFLRQSVASTVGEKIDAPPAWRDEQEPRQSHQSKKIHQEDISEQHVPVPPSKLEPESDVLKPECHVKRDRHEVESLLDDVYDDPQLVQNPWAQEDGAVTSNS